MLKHLLLATTLLSSTAYAADEDITVTARKVQENINDVPASIQYQSGEELQKQGVVRLSDVAGLGDRPSALAADGLVISSRGMVQLDLSAHVDPSVGVYQDGVYVGRSLAINSSLYDVSNIQMVRGPQGIFYGRNTPGGAVLIETNNPDPNFGGSFKASYGRFNEVNLEQVINAPIAKDLTVRIAGQRITRDGFVTDTLTGDKYNEKDTTQGRVKLLYAPSDNFQSLLTAEYSESDYNADGRRLVFGFPGFTDLVTNQTDRTSISLAPANKTKYKAVSWVNTIGNFKLTAAYQDVRGSTAQDADGTTLVLQEIDHVFNFKQYSADAQYNNFVGDLEYTVGAGYYDEKGTDTTYFKTPAYFKNDGDIHNISYAGYAYAKYSVTPKIILNGGIRYTHDTKHLTTRGANLNADGSVSSCFSPTVTAATSCSLPHTTSYDKISWLAGVDYRINDTTLLYGKVSTGYRAGGNQLKAVVASADKPFASENIIEYEIGIKGYTGPFTYSAAAFYNQLDNGQVTATYFVPVPYTVSINAAKVRNFGGEVFVTARVTEGLTVKANAIYVNPKYLDYKSPTGVDQSNYRFSGVMTKQFGFLAEYNYRNITLNADYTWTDKIPTTDRPLNVLVTSFGPVVGKAAYDITNVQANGIVNARAAIDINSMELSIWGRNVLNERYNTNPALLLPRFVSSPWSEPATYGVSAKVKF